MARPPEPHSPGALLAFAAAALDRPVRASLVQQSHRGQVLELRDGADGRWFAKQIRGAGGYRAESFAYRHWTPSLGAHAPSLRARDPERRMLVMTAAPGRHVRSPSVAELGRAGHVLHLLHTAVPTVSQSVHGPTSAQLERLLRRCERLDLAVDARWLRRRVSVLADLGAVPVVPCHGDFVPRNWLFDDEGTVRLIDYESSRLHSPAIDVARLVSRFAWDRPDRLAAILAGYRRGVGHVDLQVVDVQLVIEALHSMTVGARASHAPSIARGRRVLDACRDGFRFDPRSLPRP